MNLSEGLQIQIIDIQTAGRLRLMTVMSWNPEVIIFWDILESWGYCVWSDIWYIWDDSEFEVELYYWRICVFWLSCGDIDVIGGDCVIVVSW